MHFDATRIFSLRCVFTRALMMSYDKRIKMRYWNNRFSLCRTRHTVVTISTTYLPVTPPEMWHPPPTTYHLRAQKKNYYAIFFFICLSFRFVWRTFFFLCTFSFVRLNTRVVGGILWISTFLAKSSLRLSYGTLNIFKCLFGGIVDDAIAVIIFN